MYAQQFRDMNHLGASGARTSLILHSRIGGECSPAHTHAKEAGSSSSELDIGAHHHCRTGLAARISHLQSEDWL
eukprot:4255073-Amphidinium_carterae.6